MSTQRIPADIAEAVIAVAESPGCTRLHAARRAGAYTPGRSTALGFQAVQQALEAGYLADHRAHSSRKSVLHLGPQGEAALARIVLC